VISLVMSLVTFSAENVPAGTVTVSIPSTVPATVTVSVVPVERCSVEVVEVENPGVVFDGRSRRGGA
jgi:hypothetical protein